MPEEVHSWEVGRPPWEGISSATLVMGREAAAVGGQPRKGSLATPGTGWEAASVGGQLSNAGDRPYSNLRWRAARRHHGLCRRRLRRSADAAYWEEMWAC